MHGGSNRAKTLLDAKIRGKIRDLGVNDRIILKPVS
jgi:hypothetical protein